MDRISSLQPKQCLTLLFGFSKPLQVALVALVESLRWEMAIGDRACNNHVNHRGVQVSLSRHQGNKLSIIYSVHSDDSEQSLADPVP
jgi:hypothetical protein